MQVPVVQHPMVVYPQETHPESVEVIQLVVMYQVW